MALIDGIRAKIAGDRFEFSQHAVDQAILRGIAVQEVREAVAVVIEDYSRDKYGPSCLLLGFTATGRPIHIQCICSYPSRPLVKIITLYEPDPDQWIDLRTRK